MRFAYWDWRQASPRRLPACPATARILIEFRRDLSRTRAGKVDFKALVAEHHARSGK
jgi:hypothetical protein